MQTTQRHKLSRKNYDPTMPLDEYYLDLGLPYLKMFKNALVEFLTKQGLGLGM